MKIKAPTILQQTNGGIHMSGENKSFDGKSKQNKSILSFSCGVPSSVGLERRSSA